MATIRLTPSTYYLSNSTYLKVTDASNMYTNTSSTTVGIITHNRSSTAVYYAYLRGFNFDDIPEGAIIQSFTIKLKARELGLSTASTYAPGISNGTTDLAGKFGSLSTSQQVLSCTGVTADFDTIKGYGANFGIRIPLRRASSGTSGNVRVCGAEIAVNYSIPVTISFNANGGTGQMADVTTYGVGDSYPLPACSFTAPAGRNFDGWLVDGTRYAAGESITLTGDTTVTALWTYLATFAANGGTGTMASAPVSRDDNALVLPASTFTPPTGRDFDGWIVGGTRYSAGTEAPITGDTTITAIWTYLVSYNANGGTGAMTSSSVSRDDTYELPACTFTPPAGVDQWRFDHWTIGAEEYAAGDEAEITGDTTAVAQWARPTIYIKTGSGWEPMDAGYEKESGAWAQKRMSALFQSGHAYRKGTEES